MSTCPTYTNDRRGCGLDLIRRGNIKTSKISSEGLACMQFREILHQPKFPAIYTAAIFLQVTVHTKHEETCSGITKLKTARLIVELYTRDKYNGQTKSNHNATCPPKQCVVLIGLADKMTGQK